MNDGENKHDNFDKKEIRDFLGKQLQEVYDKGFPNLKYAEEQLEEWKIRVEIAKKGEALRGMFEELGWDEHDVSDHIKYNPKTYFCFVGTEDEHQQYIKSLEDSKENKE